MARPLERTALRWEQPATRKFAGSIVILPELFTTNSHYSLLSGYLTSVGWEVCTVDAYAGLERRRFAGLCDSVAEAIAASGREVILLGHGLGGLMAFALDARAAVVASVALAPALPGFRSPLLDGLRNRLAAIRGALIRPPSGRALFEFVADADRFQRDALIRELTPGDATALREIARGAIGVPPIGATPRLIVAGDSDIFAPHEQVSRFAAVAGAQRATLSGRGHWLVGGRALEKTVNELQRFLIKSLGRDLLLLYPPDPPDEPS
ncbi:MAG TPA: alpha/beta fold hydrolase [Candidatus Binataceae bacterium]|nr:alpha/beta fold hydrolase [Candidatus Binataceae bacterium]